MLATCVLPKARMLRFADVDVDTAVLQVRDAKGGKDARVPVSTPLRRRLADYHAQVVGRTGGENSRPHLRRDGGGTQVT